MYLIRFQKCCLFLITKDEEKSKLSFPTSSGLSRFLLDTYNNIATEEEEAVEGGGNTRPPRYGAFVFGDRFPYNVTVDWDTLRERPELLAEGLEVLGETLPTDGGEFDLKVRFFGGQYLVVLRVGRGRSYCTFLD